MSSWTMVARRAISMHQALHNEGELAVLLSILDAERPNTIIELGTWAGGSAWAFDQLPTVETIITVDPAPRPESADTLARLAAQVHYLPFKSQDPETYVTVGNLLSPNMADVLFIDGDHMYGSARYDWETYRKQVRPGGLVVIHDTQGYPEVDSVQVPRLWAEIRQDYRTTELVDRPGGPGGTGIVWL